MKKIATLLLGYLLIGAAACDGSKEHIPPNGGGKTWDEVVGAHEPNDFAYFSVYGDEGEEIVVTSPEFYWDNTQGKYLWFPNDKQEVALDFRCSARVSELRRALKDVRFIPDETKDKTVNLEIATFFTVMKLNAKVVRISSGWIVVDNTLYNPTADMKEKLSAIRKKCN